MGADIDELPDGFHVRGAERLRGGEVDARERSPPGHGVRHRGARRLGPDDDPRRRRRGRVVPGVLRGARVAARVKADKLYLVGFMGAGKRPWRARWAARLGWRVEDIDERIEARERRSVAAIFAQHGEPYFRQLERQVLSELLPERQIIVATGGGTFAEADNRALMLADGAVAWLDVPLDARHRRACPPTAAGRWPPTVRSSSSSITRRQLAYAQAHLRIDATRPVAESRRALLDWIGY